MAGTCAFCGLAGRLTGEHVLGDWLSRIGLDLEPVPHGAGPLNRVGRDLGTSPPFRRTVRDVCAACNNGWMSRLENTARRVLRPFILGEPGIVDTADQAAIATWAQKTALVAMLVSSEEERERGHGLPTSEYRALYALRDKVQPLPASQFWIGRYDGARDWAVRVTTLVVSVDGLPDPVQPQGYAMTILLGQLVLHGVRFTTPSLQVPLSTRQEMPQLWPADGPVEWPIGGLLDDAAFLPFAAGLDLQVMELHIKVGPLKSAIDLADSTAAGGMVELPTACGKHVAYYPSLLVDEARKGRFYSFMTWCECDLAYLIQTEADGAHCKAADSPEAISELYEALSGDEYASEDESGIFVCKRTPQ